MTSVVNRLISCEEDGSLPDLVQTRLNMLFAMMWRPSTAYVTGDIAVLPNGLVGVCPVSRTSSATFTELEQDEWTIAASGAGGSAAGAVRYDEGQGLTDPQKLQAKTNIGLELVENSPDAWKWVAAAGKLANPKKINGVNFDGTSDINITAPEQITPRTWHDILAFGVLNGWPTFEQRSGGSWSSVSLNKAPFDGRDGTYADLIPDSTAVDGARYTWHSDFLQWSQFGHVVLVLNNIGSVARTLKYTIQYSDNGTAWTDFGTLTSDQWSVNLDIPTSWAWGGWSWFRLLIERTSGTGGLRLTAMSALTQRMGDQGGGREAELPYAWDADQVISFRANPKLPAAPTDSAHPTRKDYVDGQISTVDGRLSAMAVSPSAHGAVGDGTTDDRAALQAAFDAAALTSGIVTISRDYAVSAPLTLPRGVRLLGPAGYKRATGFSGDTKNGVIRPRTGFSGDALLRVGAASADATNPHGALIDGVSFYGKTSGGTAIASLTGVYIRDTRDVCLVHCFLGEFDRTGSTGRGLVSEGSASGTNYGTTVMNCMFSANFEGILITGDGSTDQRISDTLVTGCSRGISLGWDDRSGTTQLGGGGTQIVNTHITYTGMPSGGWHLRLGSQAGDCVFSNIYFDQGGDAYAVQVGNVNNTFVGCHFLPAPACTREGLIRVTTSGNQNIVLTGCNLNRNGSTIKSLVWVSAKAGTPANGVIVGNMVYGTSSAWIGLMIDSAQAAIVPVSNGAFTLRGNAVTGSTLDAEAWATLAGIETFTNKTLTDPKIARILDTNGNPILENTPIAGAVNYIGIQNNVAGSFPQMLALGADTNIALNLRPKGSAPVRIYADTGATPNLAVAGPDASLGLNITTKGTGVVQANGVQVADVSSAQTLTNKTLNSAYLNQGWCNTLLDTGGKNALTIVPNASAVNYFQLNNAPTNNPVTLAAVGSDANIPVQINSKGSSAVYLNGIEAVTTSATQTLSNKTLASPKVTDIRDNGGSTVMTFPVIAGALNYLSISDGVAGQAVRITAIGEANAALDFRTQGAGNVTANGAIIVTGAAPSGAGMKVWGGTQAQYDAIGTKDANTIYAIT